MNTILSTWAKNCISVKNVKSHFATGRISRVMQKVMRKSSIQVICVKYVIKSFSYSLTTGATKLQNMLLWNHKWQKLSRENENIHAMCSQSRVFEIVSESGSCPLTRFINPYPANMENMVSS